MKTLLFLISAAAFGQILTPTASPASVRPGQTATVTLNFTGSSTASVSGIQWDLLDGPLVNAAPVGGSAANGKQLSSSGAKTLVVGINAAAQNGIPTGPLASVVMTVPAFTPPGPISVSVAAIVGADANGNAVTVTPGPAATITVLPPLGDLNGDGKVDAADFGVALGQALGVATCTTGDMNGDGKCDVRDLVLIAKQI